MNRFTEYDYSPRYWLQRREEAVRCLNASKTDRERAIYCDLVMHYSSMNIWTKIK